MSQSEVLSGVAREDQLQRDLELARLLEEQEEEFRMSQEVTQDSRKDRDRPSGSSQPTKKQRLSQEKPKQRALFSSTNPLQLKPSMTSSTSSMASYVAAPSAGAKTPRGAEETSSSSKPQVELNAQQLKVAERLAKQLHEMEMKKKVEQKSRSPVDDAQFFRIIRDKVDDQRRKLEEDENQSNQSNKEVYALFNELQGIAKDLNITFEYPEIVVIGMQSDGKSSFIEGLLGFQFNIVESNIGTRRPLIIQMINDPSKEEASCRFRRENPTPSDRDSFEDRDTPVHRLVDEIVRRTNEVAGESADCVSEKPIILCVRYCYCANLTIYDTPGFRLGGNEKLSSEIRQMVMKLIQPKNRIIVCLEQSTVEWANSVSRPIAREIDPDFSRTILINTKFDNRVKELRNKESADKYMTGENLPPNTRPFFISMPVRRNLDSNRFKNAIRDSFLEDYQKLLESEFDEDAFLPQLGMARVKMHLEKLLNEKYHQSLAPTLKALEDICNQTKLELTQIMNEVQDHDIELVKSKATDYVQSFAKNVDNLMAGSIAGEPDKNGETLMDEKLVSGLSEWPDFDIDFNIPNQKLKVYGGAQYARLLNEFEYVAHSREFPLPSPSEIASALGTSKWHSAPVLDTAAANLVQIKAKDILLPLLDVLLQRATYIMKRLFSVSVEVLKKEKNGVGILSVYERFMTELRESYFRFIEKTENDCRARLKDDFIMFTKIVDWDMLNSNGQTKEYNFLDVSVDETKKRVEEIMGRGASWLDGSRGTSPDEDGYRAVAVRAAKMFAGIRFFYAKYVKNKMNAFFLEPMLQDAGSSVVNHFFRISDAKYEELFMDGVAELKQLKAKLETKLSLCTQQRDKFKEVYFRVKQQTESKSRR